jgi:hypothetical protein
MIRKFKALGLALAAVFAISAVVTSAASATAGTLTTFPAGSTVIATAEQTGIHKFTLTDHKIGEGFATTECTTAKFTGSFVSASMEGATVFTVQPVYEGCKAFGLNATVTTTGCDYLFRTGTQSGIVIDFPGGVVTGNGAWHVTTDVVCQNTKDKDGTVTPHRIRIVTATCEVTIGSQIGLATSSVSNSGTASPETAMDLVVATNVTGIVYTVTKDGIGCPLSGTGLFTSGDYTGVTTVKAHDWLTKATVGITLH